MSLVLNNWAQYAEPLSVIRVSLFIIHVYFYPSKTRYISKEMALSKLFNYTDRAQLFKTNVVSYYVCKSSGMCELLQ